MKRFRPVLVSVLAFGLLACPGSKRERSAKDSKGFADSAADPKIGKPAASSRESTKISFEDIALIRAEERACKVNPSRVQNEAELLVAKGKDFIGLKP